MVSKYCTHKNKKNHKIFLLFTYSICWESNFCGENVENEYKFILIYSSTIVSEQ